MGLGQARRPTGWPRELGIPTPRTWYVGRARRNSTAIEGDGPFVIKPAIKGDFFHATKAKAWRADDRAELVRRFEEGARLVAARAS